MTDPARATPEGVALTTINIHAASPEVIQRVCKEISDRVLAAIPEATFTKIAEEVMTTGTLVVKRSDASHWCHDNSIQYQFNQIVRGTVATGLDSRVRKFVEGVLSSPEFAEVATNVARMVIGDIVTNQLPLLVAQAFAVRLTSAWSVPAPTLDEYKVAQDQVATLTEWARKLQEKIDAGARL